MSQDLNALIPPLPGAGDVSDLLSLSNSTLDGASSSSDDDAPGTGLGPGARSSVGVGALSPSSLPPESSPPPPPALSS